LHQQIKTTLTQLQKMNSKIGTWFQLENMFKPERIKSVQAIFGIVCAFLIGVAGVTITNLFQIGTLTKFPLFSNGIDVLPACQSSKSLFYAIVSIEFIHIAFGALMAYFFYEFLKSIDLKDPFKNLKSKKYISIAAKLGMAVFLADFINRLLLQYMVNETALKISILNVQYFILVDIIFVFALIFIRGIDLKNEIDLVV